MLDKTAYEAGYKAGYTEGLAWMRATATLMASTLRSAPARNKVHRVELDAAAQIATEICSQIDDHVAGFLDLTKDPKKVN